MFYENFVQITFCKVSTYESAEKRAKLFMVKSWLLICWFEHKVELKEKTPLSVV